MALVPVPTVTDVRDWLKLSPTSVTDAMLTTVLAAEMDEQAKVCSPAPVDGEMEVALKAAVYRRCGRHIASIGQPLMINAGSEFGMVRLPNFDAEIERLEGPYRMVVFG